MPPLFAYGTLCDPDLLAAVLGRAVDAADLVPATAPGFRAVHYPGRVYPALVEQPGAAASGVLVHRLGAAEWATLDLFEGDEYRRSRLEAKTSAGPALADYYRPIVAIAIGAPEWSLAEWRRNHKAKVLVSDGAAAAEIRARLSAQSIT